MVEAAVRRWLAQRLRKMELLFGGTHAELGAVEKRLQLGFVTAAL